MSDELTPEEKAAFESLPRERMPAGLEAKVVDAMREHGFLAKRRRGIELSRGRVAGLLAASVALVIVGYSLGLHEGSGREMLVPTQTRTTAEPERQYTELAPPPSTKQDEERQAESPAVGAVESQEMKKEKAPSPEVPTLQANEPVDKTNESPLRDDQVAPEQSRSAEVDLRAKRVQDAQSPAPATETFQPMFKATRKPAASLDSAVRPQAPSTRGETYSVAEPRQTITFTWDGQTFELEADSVRVFEDELGRTLHIYTPEGIIRIRLAE